MRNQFRIVVSFVSFAILAVAPSGLQAQADPPVVLYELLPGSTYEEGCYGQCLCPILQAPMSGTFGLEVLPAGAPFDLYAVHGAEFFVPALDLPISGSGFYRRLGEHDAMDLDLQLADGVMQAFGSGGFGPAGAEFPNIDIVVSVHQMQECYDYVLHLVAAPASSSWLAVDTAVLSWSAVAGAAGYEVICGDLGYLRGTDGDFTASTDLCLEDGYRQTSLGYDLTPGSGQALWFLVRSEGGSYGSGAGGSRDESVEASPLACP